MIVLDTHVLIWLTQEPEKIGKNATKIIKDAWQKRELAISAISFWECQMLQNKGRINIPLSVEIWRDKLLKKGLIEIAVDGEIGILSANLELHGDPADRIIIATALQNKTQLITADLKILAYQSELNIINVKK